MPSKVNKLLLKDKSRYSVCVLDDIAAENDFLNITAQKLKDGTEVLEFDGTKLCGRDYLSVAKKLRDLCGVFNALLIIRDRIDIAKLSNADGVALSKGSISPTEACKLTENTILMGYHAENEILPEENELEAVDFIVSAMPIKADIKVFRLN